MPTFKLTIAYDGTGLVGWQRQASGVSVQSLLEDACRELEGREVSITGAGRTDAGVHALGQVAAVSLTRNIDAVSLIAAINARLPDAVRVTGASEAAATFHARFHARSKTYWYRLWNAAVLSPFARRYAWHVPAPVLDVGAMAAAAARFEGRHDFAALQAAGSAVGSSERTVFSSRIVPGGGDWLDRELGGVRPEMIGYEISGSGFLRHMVRNIIGTLVEVGRGRRPVEWVSEVLASKDRSRAGPTAPAEGLFLVRVDYDAALPACSDDPRGESRSLLRGSPTGIVE